jgi:hypothetical protein
VTKAIGLTHPIEELGRVRADVGVDLERHRC